MKLRLWLLAAAVLPGAACAASPEASRTRGGGPGADPGNHGDAVQMHEGAEMYYKTPCRTPKVKCSGPLPDPGD